MDKAAIIVAGGSGTRMSSSIPKQFLLLDGKPVLFHTISQFIRFQKNIQIVLVLPQNQFSFWCELCEKHNFTEKIELVSGGETRFHSVKNGLKLIDDNKIVAIHDGVRPLVSIDTIKRCFEAASIHGCAIPVIEEVNSLRQIKNGENFSVNRAEYKIVQTPQVFQSKLIKEAFLQDYSPEFTDDASVLEKTGRKIFLIEGNYENIKITTPSDLLFADALLKNVLN